MVDNSSRGHYNVPMFEEGGAVVKLSAIYFANNMMMCMCSEGSSCDLPGA